MRNPRRPSKLGLAELLVNNRFDISLAGRERTKAFGGITALRFGRLEEQTLVLIVGQSDGCVLTVEWATIEVQRTTLKVRRCFVLFGSHFGRVSASFWINDHD